MAEHDNEVAVVSAAPVVKWAGGKARLLGRLLAKLPAGTFGTYAEPFVGGGAMFFRLSSYEPRLFKRALLSDKNPELVALYRALKKDVDALALRVEDYQRDHYRRDAEGRRAHFYEVREMVPEELSDVERGARLVFLNKTCFNGLWRVNSKGRFNVPYGRYDRPGIFDPENLRAAHRALLHAEISFGDFSEVTKKLKKGDFAYFDPPYMPVSKTANFTAYSSPFGMPEQERLAQTLADLKKRGVNAMLSNADTEDMAALYTKHGFTLDRIDAARMINSDPNKRGSVQELVVTTYEKSEETKEAVPDRPTRRNVKRVS